MLEVVERIAGQLRDAAIDSNGWTTALNEINAFVGGAGAVVLSVEERLRHAPHSSDLQELMDDYFRNSWYSHDRRDRCIPLMRQKGIAFDHEVYEIDDKDPYHAEFLGRHGRKWFAGLTANLDGDIWCLALQRSPAQGAFHANDMPRLAAVRQKLEEAASLSRVIGQSWIDGAVSALNGVGSAAIVLSGTGRILEMNEAARAIVNGARGTPTHKSFEDILRARLLDSPYGHSWMTNISLKLGEQVYNLDVTFLRDKAALLFCNASLFVRIRLQKADPRSILQDKYRLTKSEVRVAIALASGMSVETMAQAFTVTTNTIRAQLKTTYAKTEVGSQAGLVTLIGQLD